MIEFNELIKNTLILLLPNKIFLNYCLFAIKYKNSIFVTKTWNQYIIQDPQELENPILSTF